MKISQITLRLDDAQLAILEELSTHLGADRTVILRSLLNAAAESYRISGRISLPFRLVPTPCEPNPDEDLVASQWEQFGAAGAEMIPYLVATLEEYSDYLGGRAQDVLGGDFESDRQAREWMAAAENALDKACAARHAWRTFAKILQTATSARRIKHRGYMKDPKLDAKWHETLAEKQRAEAVRYEERARAGEIKPEMVAMFDEIAKRAMEKAAKSEKKAVELRRRENELPAIKLRAEGGAPPVPFIEVPIKAAPSEPHKDE